MDIYSYFLCSYQLFSLRSSNRDFHEWPRNVKIDTTSTHLLKFPELVIHCGVILKINFSRNLLKFFWNFMSSMMNK